MAQNLVERVTNELLSCVGEVGITKLEFELMDLNSFLLGVKKEREMRSELRRDMVRYHSHTAALLWQYDHTLSGLEQTIQTAIFHVRLILEAAKCQEANTAEPVVVVE